MAKSLWRSVSASVDYYNTSTATYGTEPDMREEFGRTLDGYFPEVAKGQNALLRIMSLDDDGNTIPCDCVDEITREPDKDRFCPVCVKRDTYIPTIHGVKKIQDIIPGEQVLAGDGEYHLVTNINGKLNTGNMVQVSIVGRGNIPLELTEDHIVYIYRPSKLCHLKRSFGKLCNPELCGSRCRVKHGWDKTQSFSPNILEIRADQIQPNDYVLVPRNISVSQPQVNELTVDWNKYQTSKGLLSKEPPKKITIDKDLMYFLGWYVAEGSGDAPSRKSRTVVFSLHYREKEIAENLVRIAREKFNLDGYIKTKPINKGRQVLIGCAVLSRWLHDICGRYSDFKKTPEFIWSLSSSLQQEYLKAFMLGDGHRDLQNWETVGIASRRLAEEIYIMALTNNYFPSIRFREAYIGSDGQTHNDSWYIQWLNSQQEDPNKQLARWREHFFTSDFQFSKVKKVSKSWDVCAVYDLTVDKVPNFVANGVLVHNCFSEGLIWEETATTLYKVLEKGDAANSLLDEQTSVGLLNIPLVVFYVRYSEDIKKIDKVVLVELDDAGDIVSPYSRTAIYRINQLWDYRADNGKLEYYKVFAHEESVKYLNAPSYEDFE